MAKKANEAMWWVLGIKSKPSLVDMDGRIWCSRSGGANLGVGGAHDAAAGGRSPRSTALLNRNKRLRDASIKPMVKIYFGNLSVSLRIVVKQSTRVVRRSVDA